MKRLIEVLAVLLVIGAIICAGILFFTLTYQSKYIERYEYIDLNGNTGLVAYCTTDEQYGKYCRTGAEGFQVRSYKKVLEER